MSKSQGETIASLTAERDAARQEAVLLREALTQAVSRSMDCPECGAPPEDIHSDGCPWAHLDAAAGALDSSAADSWLEAHDAEVGRKAIEAALIPQFADVVRGGLHTADSYIRDIERKAVEKAAMPHCRLVRVTESLLDNLGLRTIGGALLTAEWGEPDEFGVYTPTFTATDDGWLRDVERRAVEAAQGQIDGAYTERNLLVAHLFRAFPLGIAWWADAPDAPGYVIVYLESDEGQLSWHMKANEAQDLMPDWLRPEAKNAGKWDGHTTTEKYARLARLPMPARAALLPKPEEETHE